MPLRITLTDYGVGNLYSIRRSLENCVNTSISRYCARSIRRMVWDRRAAWLPDEPNEPMAAITPANAMNINMKVATPPTTIASRHAKKVLKKLFISVQSP